MMTSIQTYSGHRFSLLCPDPRDINSRDIAVALSRLPRLGGHTSTFYCVAQHSWLSADVIRRAIRSDRSLSRLLRIAGPDRSEKIKAVISRARQDDSTADHLLLAALLDDAPDAYLGTISPLVTLALEKIAKAAPLKTLDTAITLAVHRAFGLPFPLPADWITVLKIVDDIMLATEHRDLLLIRHNDMEFPTAAEFRIQAEPEHRAADLFLDYLIPLVNRVSRHDQAMAS